MFQFRRKQRCSESACAALLLLSAVCNSRLLLCLCWYSATVSTQELQLDLQQLQWGALSVASLQLNHPATADRRSEQNAADAPLWSLRLQRLVIANAVRLDLGLDCLRAHPMAPSAALSASPDGHSGFALASLLACAEGVIELQAYPVADAASTTPAHGISGRFSHDLASGAVQLKLPALEFQLHPDARWSLQLKQMPLLWLQQVVDSAALAQWAGAAEAWPSQGMPWPRAGHLDGELSGRLPVAAADVSVAASWQVDVQLQQLAFDNEAGDIAADGVHLHLQANAEHNDRQRWDFSAALQWLEGEWLLGRFYLPPPSAPVHFTVDGSWHADAAAGMNELRLQRVQWLHDEVIDLQASAHWCLASSLQGREQSQSRSASSLLPSGWQVHGLQIALPAFQQAYLNGWLQTRNLSDLIQSGTLQLQSSGAVTAQGMQHDSHIKISDVSLHDPGGRVAVSGLQADIHWPYRLASAAIEEASSMSWQSLSIGRLPVASTALTFEFSGADLQLQRDSMIPILDGGILLHDLHLERMFATDAELVLDAEIVPLSLRQLGEAMAWPSFGGKLSGSIPGIRREQDVWLLNGQVELALFQGRAVISGLSLERPFGVLPVLQAGIWIERLQLEPLTEAFDIGRITGPVDAYIRDLRLLNWQPVSFDAWLRTSARPQVPLRISQRAVDTLSSVGGGIGGGLQASVLRLFESFRYQSLGLSCRLSNGVCQMDGIDTADDGNGFVLIKGGGLPHLDVVAYNRRVDWQRLLTQLQAAIQSQGAKLQ